MLFPRILLDLSYSYVTMTQTELDRHAVHLESRCALRLQYVDLVQAYIDAHGHHF
jgi:hypothetical protein